MSHSFNRLIQESSPYLQQHAKNPVDWYPWCAEALQKAKDENKPILVSIGYSACHWCHVMERESFEDASTALLMNRYFVCIKVDREERPDLDHFFMDALQATSGQGGWPLNMFLTTDAKPFYGGTYFPPVAIQNRISWKELLVRIHEAYRDRRAEIEEQADSIVTHLNKSSQIDEKVKLNFSLAKEEKFQRSQLEKIRAQIFSISDSIYGGFGRAPKFPQTFTISYLLRDYHFTENKQSLDQALVSLRQMLRGGIYDQIGGGFCRYSTDNEWLAPHFEKMTYDNALLLLVMSDAYLLTKDQEFERVVEETIEFMQREMRCHTGGYCAALDADSENEEGKFYTWKSNEFDFLFGDESRAIKDFFDITDAGNWEGANIPRMKKSLDEWAEWTGISFQEAEQQVKYAKNVLLENRSKRVRPGTDDKIILGWNALYLQALSKAGMVFSRTEWILEAEEGINFLLSAFWDSSKERWLHTHKNGVSRFNAYLDDLTSLAQALLTLYEANFKVDYLKKGREIVQYVIKHFSDSEGLYFYYTPDFQHDVLVRKVDLYDGAIPSGNSVMAWNLYRYGVVFDELSWRMRAENMVEGVKSGIVKYPNSFGIWASLMQELIEGTLELVIVGPDALSSAAKVHKHFIPNKLIMASGKPEDEFPMLNREQPFEKTFFYTCREYACSLPMDNLHDWLREVLTKR